MLEASIPAMQSHRSQGKLQAGQSGSVQDLLVPKETCERLTHYPAVERLLSAPLPLSHCPLFKSREQEEKSQQRWAGLYQPGFWNSSDSACPVMGNLPVKASLTWLLLPVLQIFTFPPYLIVLAIVICPTCPCFLMSD